MKEYFCDLAVIGTGGAGLTCAMKASEAGCRVIMLDKAKNIGGTSVMARGIGAVDTAEQKADPSVHFTLGDLMREFMRQTNYNANNALIHRFLSRSGEAVDWLRANGMTLKFVGNVQGSHDTSEMKTYFEWPPQCKFPEMKKFAQTVVDRGGMLLTETAVTKVIMTDGAVSAVEAAAKDGEKILIHCSAAMLSTGGYGNNPEMIAKATGGAKVNAINTGVQTGDGIRMGIQTGAAVRNLGCIEFHGISTPFDKMKGHSMIGNSGLIGALCYSQFGLWVNHSGIRFTNEDVVEDLTYVSQVVVHQGDCIYAIYSGSVIDTLVKDGLAGLHQPAREYMEAEKPWSSIPGELEAGIGCGFVYKADTISGLAEKIGISAENLQNAVSSYNACCKAGIDSQFAKASEYLIPVEEGPFYAVEVRATELCSLGGLDIDLNMNVLKEDGTPITGLYSGGVDCSGGLFDSTYVSLEGITMGWTVTSGYLAGESIAHYLKG